MSGQSQWSADLVGAEVLDVAGEGRLPARHHGPVLHLVRELWELVVSKVCREITLK